MKTKLHNKVEKLLWNYSPMTQIFNQIVQIALEFNWTKFDAKLCIEIIYLKKQYKANPAKEEMGESIC